MTIYEGLRNKTESLAVIGLGYVGMPIAVAFANKGFNVIGFDLKKEKTMRLIIALILPWLTFFTIGRPISGIICLILQVTLIGWLPATIWAIFALNNYSTDKKIAKALGNK